MGINIHNRARGSASSKTSIVRSWVLGPLALLLGATAGCGTSAPSADSAQQAVESRLDKGTTNRLRLLSFQKTDGRAMEAGVQAYELFFVADVEFVANAMYSGGSLLSQGSEISTAEYREPSQGFSWDEFLAGSQGVRPAMKGDRLHLSGSVMFERRESGWVPVGVRFEFEHDETTRDMEAIRRANEQREREEAERQRLEAERIEQLAREQAARDAAAEKTSFVIRGPVRQGYESGTYWIGRLTSSDLLLFQAISGDLKQVSVYVDGSSVRWPDTHNHPPGDHVENGHFGGTGDTYNVSGDLRIEMGRIRGAGTRDIFVTLSGVGEVEVSVTVLCHKVEGAPPCSGR